MKRQITKLLCFVLTAVMTLTVCLVPASAAQSSPAKVVALGDSIMHGVYVNTDERFGEVLCSMLGQDGVDTQYISYSVPKYGVRSISYDFNEETYGKDNDRYFHDHADNGAKDYRGDVLPYAEYISGLENADLLLFLAGENDVVARFYALRGFEDYYIFFDYYTNQEIFQNAANNREIEWAKQVLRMDVNAFVAEWEDYYREYMTYDIASLRELNPTAQLMLLNYFNPFQDEVDGLEALPGLFRDMMKDLHTLSRERGVLVVLRTALHLAKTLAEMKRHLRAVVPLLLKDGMNACDGIDLSAYSLPEKLLYKIGFLRAGLVVVELFRSANRIVEEIAETYDATLVDVASSEVYTHMAHDGYHPNAEGHRIIAQLCYDALDMDRLN